MQCEAHPNLLVRPKSAFAIAWRWSKFGRGSSSNDLMSTASCSLEILQRFGFGCSAGDSSAGSGGSWAVSAEVHELEGDEGAPAALHAQHDAAQHRRCGAGAESAEPRHEDLIVEVAVEVPVEGPAAHVERRGLLEWKADKLHGLAQCLCRVLAHDRAHAHA